MIRHNYSVAVFLSVMVLSFQTGLAAGILDEARNDVQTPNDSGQTHSSSHRPRHNGHIHVEETALAFELFMYVFTSPFWLPYQLLESEEGLPDSMQFHIAPYIADGRTYMTPDVIDRPFAPGCASFEIAQINSNTQRISGRARIEGFWRFGLDVGIHRFEEELSGGGYDAIQFEDLFVTIRFAQSERIQLRTGLGWRVFDDDLGPDRQGWAFLYAIDIQPFDPFVASFAFDVGGVGNAVVSRTRIEAGAVISIVEPYVGVEWFRVDNTELDSVFAGVRIYF
ncbi:MAG: hypothetical protein ABIH86_07620 [Planctomycetota bacterium]